MDVKCLSTNEFGPKKSSDGLWDLTQPSFVYIGIDVDIISNYNYIDVQEWHEMRIDLLFMDMYQLEPNAVFDSLSDIDVILAINNIDNPLNIKKGMRLRFPSQIGDISNLRIRTNDSKVDRSDSKIMEKLVVPNKSTRKDKSREDFKENGYSLPPTVLNKPKDPVRILNNNPNFSTISIGGL